MNKKSRRNIIFFLYSFFWKKRNGIQKKVKESILSPYVPINDNICIDSLDHVHVYAIKFQGNPVSIFPLRNSNIEKIKD